MDQTGPPSFDGLPPIIENVPGIIFRLLRDGEAWRISYVTGNVDRFGYEVDDFFGGGKQWSHLIHPDDRPRVLKEEADYEAKGITSYILRYRVLARNNDVVAAVEHNSALRDNTGRVACLDKVIIAADLARTVVAETDSRANQQLALNDILLSLHHSDPDRSLQIALDRAGKYLDISRVILSRDFCDGNRSRIDWEWCNRDIPSVAEQSASLDLGAISTVRDAVRSYGRIIINHGEIPEDCREEFAAEGIIASATFAVYRGGEYCGFICFDDCVHERTWDEDGLRFLGNIANIVSTILSRRLEKTLYEQNQKAYEAVLDNVDSYIFAVGITDDVIIFANHAFRKVFGDDCVGVRAENLLGLSYEALAAIKAGIEPGSGAYPEFYCEASGEWLAASDTVIRWVTGKMVRLVNCYNVTAKKLFADALENSSQAKSDFLVRTSHEIRTPMSAIIGMAELILRESADGAVTGHARNIKQAAVNLLAVVNDILDFSKIESGKVEITPVAYSLGSLLNDVVSVVRVRMAEKPLLFTVNMDARIPDQLYGDEVRIRQILLNLLGNAVKFTARGSIALEVVGSVDKTNKRVALSMRVIDTGVGIREEDLESLFDDFVRLDSRKGIEGSGLGLPIARNLALAMGGDITVESRYNAGSVFTLSLTQKFDSLRRLAAVDDPGGKCLLIYDTRRQYVESLLRTCRNLGVECHAATGEEEYADRLRQRVYTHVLVASHLYRAARKLHDKLRLASNFVALDGLEPAGATGVRTLAMPAHALSVANMLNDVRGEDDAGYDGPGFVAPEARVLVVDDSKVNLEVAVGLMEPYRMRVDACTSGAKALELIGREEYDLIFMDHMMPEMDGVEVCQLVRAMPDERFRMLPIVALTANAVSGMREMFLQNGMNDFVAKPIETPKLAETLERWIPAAKKMRVDSLPGRTDTSVFIVSGVDTVQGLQNVGGSMERYLEILDLFQADCDRVRIRLRESAASGNMKDFTIHVHSLKGACASVGATAMARRAAALEEAGRLGDAESIAAKLETTLEEFSRLCMAIKAMLTHREDAERNARRPGDANLLGEKVVLLRAALRAADFKAAREHVEYLNRYSWSGSVERRLTDLAEAVSCYDLHAAEGKVLEVEAAFMRGREGKSPPSRAGVV